MSDSFDQLFKYYDLIKEYMRLLSQKQVDRESKKNFRGMQKKFLEYGDHIKAADLARVCGDICIELLAEEYKGKRAEMKRLAKSRPRKPAGMRERAKEWIRLSGDFENIDRFEKGFKEASKLSARCADKAKALKMKANKKEIRTIRLLNAARETLHIVLAGIYLYILCGTDILQNRYEHWLDTYTSEFSVITQLFPLIAFSLAVGLLNQTYLIKRTKQNGAGFGFIVIIIVSVVHAYMHGTWTFTGYYNDTLLALIALVLGVIGIAPGLLMARSQGV
jgi:hypothetical protein